MRKTAMRIGAAGRIAACGLLLAGLAACMGGTDQTADGGIGFREARYTEISAMRDYRACRDEAIELDRQARQAGEPARYLASARLIEQCEAQLGPEAASLAPEERMRAYALGIQNYLKGGDVAAARAKLESFKSAFDGHDLYYADGSSFTETMEVLLGLRDRTAIGQFSIVNVGGEVKSELRRARYWTHN